MQYIINVYESKTGKLPYLEWLNDLDSAVRQKIHLRIGRLSLGNFGNCKSLDQGLFEIKIDSGPGYRVYFSLIGSKEILILFAGTKRTQQEDIEKALKYLSEYKNEEKKHVKK